VIKKQWPTMDTGLYIIFASLPEMSASSAYQNLRYRWTETTHQERVGRSESCCHWMCLLANAARVYRLAFTLEAGISIIWCKDDVTYYTFHDNCQSRPSVFNDSINWHSNLALTAKSVASNFQNSDGMYFKESGHFMHSFVKCLYSGTCLPIFLEISSYLTDTEQ